MSLSNLSDAELLMRWRAGEVDAGEVLIRRHHPRIRRVFGVNGWNKDWVADRVQQTFLIFCERRDRIQDPEKVKSFLLGIANNLLREHYKEKYRGRDPVDKDADEMVDSEVPGFSTLFSNEQEKNLLNTALSRLPFEMRMILQLQYWDQLAYQEIAEIMQIPIGTVASRLRAAKARLALEMRRLRGWPRGPGEPN